MPEETARDGRGAPPEEAREEIPFESRIVIREDGTVVVEHAGEGLEDLAALLRGDRDAGQRFGRACSGPASM